MSNCQTIELPTLTVSSLKQVATVLRPILHTTVFNRSFQCYQCEDKFDEELGFSYAMNGDDSVKRLLHDKLSEFILWLQRRDLQTGTIKLAFHDRPVKKNSFFTEERIQSCWEEWLIPVSIVPNPLRHSEFQSQVREAVDFILGRIAAVKYSIPVVRSFADTIEITVVTDNRTTRALESIKKAIVDVNLPSILH